MAGEPAAVVDNPTSTNDADTAGDMGFAEFANQELSGQLPGDPGQAPGGTGVGAAPPPSGDAPDPTGQVPPAEGVSPEDHRPPADEAPPATPEHPLTNLRELITTGGEHLPEGMADSITQALGQFEQYTEEVDQYAQRAEAHYQNAANIVQQMEAIAADPRFQQALATITGQPAPGTSAGVGAPTGADRPAPPKAPDFDSEGEKYLDGRHRELVERTTAAEQEIKRMRQEAQAERDQATESRRQQLLTQGTRDIKMAHGELDKQFPSLSGDAAKRKEWHRMAAEMYDIQKRRGESGDVRQALTDAGKVLAYDGRHAEGGKAALEAARKAATASTRAPGISARAAGEEHGTAKTVKEIYYEEKARLGV